MANFRAYVVVNDAVMRCIDAPSMESAQRYLGDTPYRLVSKAEYQEAKRTKKYRQGQYVMLTSKFDPKIPPSSP